MQFSFDQKKSHHRLYLKYTAAFLIVALFVYGTYLVTGHSFIWYIDGANQHLPLLKAYRQTLAQFIHHPFHTPQWSWKMGLGAAKFPIFAYYDIGDVFAYLTLLFPVSKIVLAYHLIIVLRLYCVGLAFCFFARHFKALHTPAIITGSLVYTFNAFLLYANCAQPFFATPFIIFPLVLLAIERVLQGKSCWPLIGAFTWMLISNFYFAYMLGIGAFIYLALRVLITYRSRLNYPVVLARLAGATITSLLLAGFILVPELHAVLNSTRSGSPFANGMHVYPPYYYLALPSQLINGGNRDFYFWTALGFASIALFGITYVLRHIKRYPVIATSILISGGMLLLPCFAAFMNAFMSPSNRWTLMLCLPVALACAILAERLPHLSGNTLKLFTLVTVGYTGIIFLDYLFENNEMLFIPMVFLYVTLLALWLLHRHGGTHSRHWLLAVVLLNVLFNAVYFEAPYNGGYSKEMLPLGAFQNLEQDSYNGLADGLTGKTGYRVSTLSQNYQLGADYTMYNNLAAPVNLLNSYYSIQNKYVGQFAQEMQNTQYEANYPLQQLDDRTALLDFLNVKYLFTQIGNPNANKIPAGFVLDKTTQKVTGINGQPGDSQQTRRYKNTAAFPLLYWQDRVVTPHQAKKLSATQRERALAAGVTVSDAHDAAGLTPASLSNLTVAIPYELVSSHGVRITGATKMLQRQDANESYTIVLNPRVKGKQNKQLKKLRNYELHLEFTNVHYTPMSLRQQVRIEAQTENNDLTRGPLAKNTKMDYYRYLHYHVVNGTPNHGFTLKVAGPNGTEKLYQPKRTILSFYKIVHAGTMNLGFIQRGLPQTLTLTPSKMGTYRFKLRVVAEPLGKQYFNQVKTVQRHALQNVRLNGDRVTGTITTSRVGILASSIPYSTGWRATDNGHPVKVLRVNTAFVGLRLPKGQHHIVLSYHVPALKLGALVSLVGISVTLIAAGVTLVIRRTR